MLESSSASYVGVSDSTTWIWFSVTGGGWGGGGKDFFFFHRSVMSYIRLHFRCVMHKGEMEGGGTGGGGEGTEMAHCIHTCTAIQDDNGEQTCACSSRYLSPLQRLQPLQRPQPLLLLLLFCRNAPAATTDPMCEGDKEGMTASHYCQTTPHKKTSTKETKNTTAAVAHTYVIPSSQNLKPNLLDFPYFFYTTRSKYQAISFPIQHDF